MDVSKQHASMEGHIIREETLKFWKGTQHTGL